MIAGRSVSGFDALLLAGGASRRMGRDKALLPVGTGRVLWQRQCEILRALEPHRLFFSGPARPGMPEDVELLADATPGLGPLSGVVQGLKATQMPLLLVLAVDLPAMTAEYLSGLLAECDHGRGCVPKCGPWFEPLAAVYPREALGVAEMALESEDRSLQAVVRVLIQENRLCVKIAAEADDVFRNWNEP